MSANKQYGLPSEAVIHLVDGGVAANDALATARSVATSVCGLADRKGWVCPGCDVDLLLICGDLLVDIAALGNVRAVYLRGAAVCACAGSADGWGRWSASRRHEERVAEAVADLRASG